MISYFHSTGNLILKINHKHYLWALKLKRIKSKNIYVLLLLSILSLASCQASFGEKYERGNLEIYYTQEMNNFVEPTADYFERNGLIQNEKHSIQLTSSTLEDQRPGFVLKMVLKESQMTIPMEKMYNITLLEEDLIKEVFKDTHFRIAICNENFVEIN